MIVNCPHCGGPIDADDPLAGGVVSCPHCRKNLRLPADPIPEAKVAPAPNPVQVQWVGRRTAEENRRFYGVMFLAVPVMCLVLAVIAFIVNVLAATGKLLGLG